MAVDAAIATKATMAAISTTVAIATKAKANLTEVIILGPSP